MTTLLEQDAPRTPERRASIVWLAAAAALVVLTVGLVLTFGVQRPPELASVTDDPQLAPPGELAWVAWDADGRSCLHVATVDGGRREVTCGRDLGELVAWTDEGLILRTWDVSERVTVLDPDDGSVLARRAFDAADDGPWRDQAAWSTWEDGWLTVRDQADDEVLWRVDAPSSYRIEVSVRSPDGGAIAATDSAGRLLLLDSEPAPPSVWLEGVDSWVSLVWSPDARG